MHDTIHKIRHAYREQCWYPRGGNRPQLRELAKTTAPNPNWAARAALFVRERAVTPITKLCARKLHNVYEVGVVIAKQTVNGKQYTTSRCKACARDSSKRSRQRAA